MDRADGSLCATALSRVQQPARPAKASAYFGSCTAAGSKNATAFVSPVECPPRKMEASLEVRLERIGLAACRLTRRRRPAEVSQGRSCPAIAHRPLLAALTMASGDVGQSGGESRQHGRFLPLDSCTPSTGRRRVWSRIMRRPWSAPPSARSAWFPGSALEARGSSKRRSTSGCTGTSPSSCCPPRSRATKVGAVDSWRKLALPRR